MSYRPLSRMPRSLAVICAELRAARALDAKERTGLRRPDQLERIALHIDGLAEELAALQAARKASGNAL